MSQSLPYQIALDTGGTFTDCIGVTPSGALIRRKVLSKGTLRGEVLETLEDGTLRIKANWGVSRDVLVGYRFTAPQIGEPIRQVTSYHPAEGLLCVEPPIKTPFKGKFEICGGEDATVLGLRLMTETRLDEPLPNTAVRLGTTRGTNALLERKGSKIVFVTTRGFGDSLEIGTQARPDIFARQIEKNRPLASVIVEATERIDADGTITHPLDVADLKEKLAPLTSQDIEGAAVCLVNAYRNPAHEQAIGALLRSLGFSFVTLSSDLSTRMSYLSRARTSTVNAYLLPVIERYLQALRNVSGISSVRVMGSAGGLIPSEEFSPKESLLSGPAGGCIGMAMLGGRYGQSRLIGLDMGGTSTDVSRFDGEFDYKYEVAVGDGEIFSQALDIHTVAAGGGSICSFDGFKLDVGPESAGADPGPACYGMGGPLTITDINLLAGRLCPTTFSIPIDISASRTALLRIIDAVEAAGHERPDEQRLINGFLAVADEKMAGAVRTISARKGFDTAHYTMVAFGGAGGLHACAVADKLGIQTVLLPADAGILSAYGLLSARLEQCVEKQILEPLDRFVSKKKEVLTTLEQEARATLQASLDEVSTLESTRTIFCRFTGQNSTLPIADTRDIRGAFKQAYTQLFGHCHDDTDIEVEMVRVMVRPKARMTESMPLPSPQRSVPPTDHTETGLPIFSRDSLETGASIEGPAVVIDAYSACYIETGWHGICGKDRTVVMTRTHPDTQTDVANAQATLSLYANRFAFIADTMGETLRRTAASVNVKERLDFSSAVLDDTGRLVANAHHIPVHLGALGVAVRSVLRQCPMAEGDVIITNHPAFGGSHLPDVTVISPVFVRGRLIAHAASRAHHAELGGRSPGSMPPNAASLVEEGVIIPPTYLCRNGVWHYDRLKHLLERGPYPSRALATNIDDVRAQVAANLKGVEDLKVLAETVGADTVRVYFSKLRENARAEMSAVLNALPLPIRAEESLDDGTPLVVTWYRGDDGRVVVDWSGSGPVHPENLNGTRAVATSAVLYVLRLLLDRPAPLNDGLLEPLTLVLPEGIVSPRFDERIEQNNPAVAGGNTELSQRMVDVMIRALGLCAAGQGTMNNLLFGNERFGYYETIGGGAGAGPDFDGESGVHTHMTNTRITDVEIIEYRYPVRVVRFQRRRRSGGRGIHCGGDGLIRELCMLEPVTLSFISERRRSGPTGIFGGERGAPGHQYLILNDGRIEPLGGRDTTDLSPGDRVVIETPGGGGWGKP